ncbi:unnamed protein product [Diatraea saccharalis]|uniref:Alpha-ketoglutarate-dependent dioxygenase AlkB-like domain-containing protein n=1 Tax=Diatraea saccharalis TaxID=40085 RepID=A0A9N9R235_9NEOP|nr:unnamed protein product [Diatraea saccharalis]
MKEDENFMGIFKYFKSKKPKPSLENVVSVENNRHNDKVIRCTLNQENDARTEGLGLDKFENWQMYYFKSHPGLYLIRNPFTNLGQRYWIRKCLEEYPRKPNKTNIDFEVYLEDWWETCYSNEVYDQSLLQKLRWTTLGYHHNWDTKVYTDENQSPFPPELAELADVVALYLGCTTFKAQAAIVNYYYMKSTLSAHTDHSEINLEAPLFSFSFGQSAIFLIGGLDKSVAPTAILLQSGDILVMSKEARLCYHAVPKILPASSTPWNENLNEVTEKISLYKYISQSVDFHKNMNRNINCNEWSKFGNYVDKSRININVRQVLKENQNRLQCDVLLS